MSTHDSIFRHIQEQVGMVRAMEAYRRQLLGIDDALIRAAAAVTRPPAIIAAEAALQGILDRHRQMEDVTRAGLSALASPAWSASQSVAALLASMRPARELAEQMSKVSKEWQARLAPIEQMRLMAVPPPALQAHVSRIAEMTMLSEAIASRFAPDALGHSFIRDLAARQGVLHHFTEFSASYANLLTDVGHAEGRLLAFPPAFTARPAAEYFNEVDLLDTLGVEEVIPELEEERQVVREDIAGQTAEPLRECLGQRYPDLLELLDGARTAHYNEGPDFVRHFTTSLRELFTHLLHRLSPDDEVKTWSTSPDDLDRGRPTRAGRLRFICRDIAHDRFKDFVKKDVAAAVEFIGLFQGGTHEVVSSYTPAQLRALLARMEGLLYFLLEITHPD